jgi:small nuclear ribonucleoprotein (snRNP)-like protein
VVIFPGHLKDIGDVRQLQDRVIEVHGTLKEYDGRAEIVLQNSRQLTGDAARIPRLPKNYDVENKGHYSAGTFSLPKAPRPTYPKKQLATMPVDIPEDEGTVSAPAKDSAERR